VKADKFNDASEREIQELLTRYPTKQAALLPVLWVAEREFGWISPEVMEMVARRLDVSPAHVYGVVTFYTMYQKEPPAQYHVQVCQTLPCAMMGCGKVIAHLEDRLGVKAGETTKDRRFKLSTVECLASCGTAPAMRVNDTYYENLTEAEIDRLIEKWNSS
jgi:NADH-quinone oxidoreductase subunit E